jgi:hypothetical protein
MAKVERVESETVEEERVARAAIGRHRYAQDGALQVWVTLKQLGSPCEPSGPWSRGEREESADRDLTDDELREAFTFLPVEMMRYLVTCADRILDLSGGNDWRRPAPLDENGIQPNSMSYIMGTSAAPPLNPTQAAKLIATALNLTWKGGNAFAKSNTLWRAEWLALEKEFFESEEGKNYDKSFKKAELMRIARVADERSFYRLLATGKKQLEFHEISKAAIQRHRAGNAKGRKTVRR